MHSFAPIKIGEALKEAEEDPEQSQTLSRADKNLAKSEENAREAIKEM